jgi:hypothetical protein
MRNAVAGIAALLFVSGFVGGCAADPSCPKTPANAPIEHITVRSPGNFTQVALQGSRMFGPDFDVVRCDTAYRGTAVKRTVDLTVQPDKIAGMIGTGRTDLHITKLPDGFELRGLYAGKLGDFTYRSERIDGQLGGRVFHLRTAGGAAATPAAQVTPGGPSTTGSAPANQEGSSAAQGSAATGEKPDKGSEANWTAIEMPASFLALPYEHQAAVLAIFLGR